MYLYYNELNDYLNQMEIENQIPKESIERLYKTVLNNFLKYLSESTYFDTPVKNLTEHIIDKYFLSISSKATRATIINRFRALKIFFDYLYKNGITSHIFLNLELDKYLNKCLPNITVMPLSKEEVEKFYRFINDCNNNISDRLFLALMLYQGLSKGEISLLKRSNIDFDFLYLYTRKSIDQETSEKFLSEKVASLIKQYILEFKIAFNEPLFNYKGNADNKFNRDITQLSKKIIGRKVTPTNLRESLRIKLIEKDKRSLALISVFFGEGPKNTFDFAIKNGLISDEDFENIVREACEID